MSSKLLALAASLLIAGGAALAQTGPIETKQGETKQGETKQGETKQVEVKNAWARATPGKAENGAAYLTIVSPVADRLTAISTPEAKTAELHNMTMEGGVMKMRPLAAVDLPAGQPVTLKPGGTHIMLMGLTQPLKQGDTFALTLSFEKAGSKQVAVAVEGAGATAPHAEGMGNMPMKH